MDVCGNAPRTEDGEHFRNSIMHWGALADYVCSVAPDLTGSINWYWNNGQGLDDGTSIMLADRLQAEIDSGRTSRYARNKVVIDRTKMIAGVAVLCLSFGGTVKTEPFFDVATVQGFANFLRSCGGFRIC